jgi:WD40 repeat protein
VSVDHEAVTTVWNRRTRKPLTTLRGHQGAVQAAVLSADGTSVLTAGDDGTAIVWDWESGQQLTVLRGHRGPITNAAFLPGGTAVTTGEDATIRFWTRLMPRPVRTLRVAAELVDSLAISPDGAYLLAGDDDRTATLWDRRTGRRIRQLRERVPSPLFDENPGPFLKTAFSPDGHRILASTDVGVRIWDTASGRSLAFLEQTNLDGGGASFSPDGTRVVVANYDGAIRIWDWATGRVVTEFSSGKDPVYAAAFTPDGSAVVASTGVPEPRTWVWDWAASRVLATFDVAATSTTPDGRLLMTQGLSVEVRDWRSGRTVADLRGAGGAFDARFSPDGRFAVVSSGDVSTGEGGLQIWNWAAEAELLRIPLAPFGGVAVSPDGGTIAAASGNTVSVYACPVCGSLPDLLAYADTVVTRRLTAAERARYVDAR